MSGLVLEEDETCGFYQSPVNVPSGQKGCPFIICDLSSYLFGVSRQTDASVLLLLLLSDHAGASSLIKHGKTLIYLHQHRCYVALAPKQLVGDDCD